jgi:pyruvate dehydrogenase E1 component beta subunit
VIAEIETDKATMEVEAVDEGVVEAILVPAGTEGVKVNSPIARLKGEGNGASAPVGHAPDEAARPGVYESARSAEAPTPPDQQQEPTPRPAHQDSAAAGLAIQSAADPEIPAGTEMVRITVRDACATPWPRRCGAILPSS